MGKRNAVTHLSHVLAGGGGGELKGKLSRTFIIYSVCLSVCLSVCPCLSVSVFVSVESLSPTPPPLLFLRQTRTIALYIIIEKDTDRDRETDRETETETHTETRHTHRDTDIETEKETDRQTETERETERHRERQRDRQRQRTGQRSTCTERSPVKTGRIALYREKKGVWGGGRETDKQTDRDRGKDTQTQRETTKCNIYIPLPWETSHYVLSIRSKRKPSTTCQPLQSASSTVSTRGEFRTTGSGTR